MTSAVRLLLPSLVVLILALPAGVAAGPWIPVRQSVGAPDAGTLRNASRLRRSRAVKLRFPKNTWGTRRMVDLVEQCAREVRVRHKGGHRLLVGDLSRRRGGYMPPHSGHRNGREADIGFYMRKGRPLGGLWPVRETDIDVRRTWAYLDCMIRSGEVVRIFLDRGLQAPLYREARRLGRSRADLARLFSYPRAKRVHVGLFQHRRGHDNHLHVRIRCAAHEVGCRDQPRGRRRQARVSGKGRVARKGSRAQTAGKGRGGRKGHKAGKNRSHAKSR